MDLSFWLPALFLFGLGTMLAMIAFIFGCEKV